MTVMRGLCLGYNLVGFCVQFHPEAFTGCGGIVTRVREMFGSREMSGLWRR